MQNMRKATFQRSDGGTGKVSGRVGCDAVWTGRCLPTFRSIVVPSSSGSNSPLMLALTTKTLLQTARCFVPVVTAWHPEDTDRERYEYCATRWRPCLRVRYSQSFVTFQFIQRPSVASRHCLQHPCLMSRTLWM